MCHNNAGLRPWQSRGKEDLLSIPSRLGASFLSRLGLKCGVKLPL